jgi:class 3 adenylate cyclase
MKERTTRGRLAALLQERNAHPERAPEIDEQIRRDFSQTLAVLVMDMSGFSRQTLRHGIIHFLAQIHRMRAIATPVIEGRSGLIVKYEADNVFAVFPEVEAAVAAALNLDRGLESANTMLPEACDMHGEFGIGYGEVLVLDDGEVYGSEVNLASKLGEDVAQRGEILLTESAFARVGSGEGAYEPLRISVSGLELNAYKVRKGAGLRL